MFLVVGDKIYNPKSQPIMIVLSQEDKKNIGNMAPEACCYCAYMDEDYSSEDITDWMNTMTKQVFASALVKIEEEVAEEPVGLPRD